MTPHRHFCRMLVLCLFTVGLSAAAARAQTPAWFKEGFGPGYQYHVSTRVEITGSLTPPPVVPEAGKPAPPPAKPVPIIGQSAIEYDERALSPDRDNPRTIRMYRQLDLRRKIGEEPQESSLRQAVRRVVILRTKSGKVSFAPDGPLTWGEIDLLRADLFIPALAGLLPDRPVRPGDRWNAAAGAVQELTDLEQIEEGNLECRLEEVSNLAGRRLARISINGSVRGLNEDGPTRQQIDGSFYFDLDSNHLSYLAFKGVHLLLDGAGKEVGRIEGRFVMSRQLNARPTELADAALRGLALEPNADNTLLLYDNPSLGVRFLYPRRWRVGAVRGAQVALDETNGNGLLLTLDALPRLPTAAQFLAEARDHLEKQKAKLLRVQPPARLQGPPQELDYFSLDMEMAGQTAAMVYYVIRQANGGATLAARLLPRDLAEMQKDVDRIARSVVITGQLK